MKKRAARAAVVYAVIFGVLFLYYLFVRLTGLGIPCVFHKITSLSCPGCGNSRALISLLHLDFSGAFKYNAFIFPELLFAGYVASVVTVRYIKTGKYSVAMPHEHILWVFLAVLVVWTVARNIIGI